MPFQNWPDSQPLQSYETFNCELIRTDQQENISPFYDAYRKREAPLRGGSSNNDMSKRGECPHIVMTFHFSNFSASVLRQSLCASATQPAGVFLFFLFVYCKLQSTQLDRIISKGEMRKGCEAGTIHRWFTGVVLLG